MAKRKSTDYTALLAQLAQAEEEEKEKSKEEEQKVKLSDYTNQSQGVQALRQQMAKDIANYIVTAPAPEGGVSTPTPTATATAKTSPSYNQRKLYEMLVLNNKNTQTPTAQQTENATVPTQTQQENVAPTVENYKDAAQAEGQTASQTAKTEQNTNADYKAAIDAIIKASKGNSETAVPTTEAQTPTGTPTATNTAGTTNTGNNYQAMANNIYKNLVGGTTDTVNPVQTAQTEAESVADRQRRIDEAKANATYQRMIKYLPQINKDKGYAGLGISESTKAEAWNDLQTKLAQIALNYDLAKEQSATGDELGSAEQSYLDALYNEYGYNADGGVTFESNKQDKGLTAGDNFRVRGADGTTYYIESGGEVLNLNELTEADTVNNQALIYFAGLHNDGDVFKLGDSLYMVKDGRVYAVQQRKNTEKKSYNSLLDLYRNS